VRLEVRGVNLQLYVGGALTLSVADSALAVAGQPGLGLLVPTVSTVYYDNWYGGDFLETKNQPPNVPARAGYSVQ
jgi:hypothetical protein